MKSEDYYQKELKLWISERVVEIKFQRDEIDFLLKQATYQKTICVKKKQSIDLSIEHIKSVAKEENLTGFLTLCMDGKTKGKKKIPKAPKARKIKESGKIYRIFEKYFKFVKR